MAANPSGLLAVCDKRGDVGNGRAHHLRRWATTIADAILAAAAEFAVAA